MIRAVALAFLGTTSFAAVYFGTAPDRPAPVAPATVGSIRQPADTTSAADEIAFTLRPGPDQRIAQTEVRDVTPETMTAAPQAATAPAREAAPQPDAASSASGETRRLFAPLVAAAGTFEVDGHALRIAGVEATSLDRTCGEGAAAWPCGRVARAALRRFVRGRAIECDVPAGSASLPDEATCRVGNDDIAEWLVSQGWAKPSGTAHADAAKAAENDGRGLFSRIRPDAQADIAAR
jgi:endonuclease YncB( thermonuclease family)